MAEFFKANIDKFFIVFMIGIFSYFLLTFTKAQNEVLEEMHKQLTEYSSQHSFIDKEGTILNKVLIENNLTNQEENPFPNSKIVEQKVNIPLEILKEVKSFNEVLSQRQNETLQLIVYVVAFVGIIATFFGYKTIKDIKESAEKESNKISDQYTKSYELLNNQVKLSNDFYQLQYKRFEEDLNKKQTQIEEKFSELLDKYNELKDEFNQKNQQVTDNFHFETKKASESAQEAQTFFEIPSKAAQ